MVVQKINPLLPYQLLILLSSSSPTGTIYQQGDGIIEIYACYNSLQQSVAPYFQEIIDSVMMGRTHLKQFTGKEPIQIIVLVNKMQLICSTLCNNWHFALAYY